VRSARASINPRGGASSPAAECRRFPAYTTPGAAPPVAKRHKNEVMLDILGRSGAG